MTLGSRTLWQKLSSKLGPFHRLDCFRICWDSWSILQFDDLSWSGLRRQRWKTWCFHLLSEINHMFFHDLFYRDYDFWISPSWSLQSRLDQRYKKVREFDKVLSKDCLLNSFWHRTERFDPFVFVRSDIVKWFFFQKFPNSIGGENWDKSGYFELLLSSLLSGAN